MLGVLKKRHYVHKVVALTFLGSRPIGFQINHKNGVKTDNRVENLEFVTPSRNRRHAVELGFVGGMFQKKDAHLFFEKIKKLYSSGRTMKEIGEVYQVSRQTISRIIFSYKE